MPENRRGTKLALKPAPGASASAPPAIPAPACEPLGGHCGDGEAHPAAVARVIVASVKGQPGGMMPGGAVASAHGHHGAGGSPPAHTGSSGQVVLLAAAFALAVG